MTENAIFHKPESQYCFAVNENTVKLRLRIAKCDSPDKIEVVYGPKYSFAAEQLTKEMKITAQDRLYKYYSAELSLCDLRLTYIFKITENGHSLYYSEDGLTQSYSFEYNYYNCFQYSYLNKSDIHRVVSGANGLVFYQIFVDRFCKGNQDKDCFYINLDWGEIPTAKSFAGGDLNGITQKLDYILNLGANCIYLTPIFKAPSNHKYDTQDYYTVDEMFGGEKALCELVEAAHKKGIRVVLDAVFNHCSETNAMFEDVKANGKASKYSDWFIINSFEPLEYECFAACKYMPKFNTSNPDARSYLIEIAKHWTKKLGIDGWRLDVSDEVSHTFWREFRKEIKKINENCILIGENWHDASNYLSGDQFDGIMNYALTKALLDFLCFEALSATEFAEKLNGLLMRNTDTANRMMLNLIDSHDTHRFLTRACGNKEKLLSALSAVFFFPGIPCIYYGTENEMLGGYDPDSRRTFDWSLESKSTCAKLLIKELSGLKAEPDFRNGEFLATSKQDLAILERKGEKTAYRLIINGSNNKTYCQSGLIKPYGCLIEKYENHPKEEV